jgi:hypothetical protein
LSSIIFYLDLIVETIGRATRAKCSSSHEPQHNPKIHQQNHRRACRRPSPHPRWWRRPPTPGSSHSQGGPLAPRGEGVGHLRWASACHRTRRGGCCRRPTFASRRACPSAPLSAPVAPRWPRTQPRLLPSGAVHHSPCRPCARPCLLSPATLRKKEEIR